MIRKYRKKPVVIDAIKFEYTDAGIKLLIEFCGSSLKGYGKDRSMFAIGWAWIGTLEDGGGPFEAKHVATEGDWIIKGVQGEFYPCKPDIFEITYDEVNDSHTSTVLADPSI